MVKSKMTLTVVHGDHGFQAIIYTEFIFSHNRRHSDLTFPLIPKAFFFYILAHLNSVSPCNKRYQIVTNDNVEVEKIRFHGNVSPTF